MTKRLLVAMIALATLMVCAPGLRTFLGAQARPQAKPLEPWNNTTQAVPPGTVFPPSGPAPRRSLAGIWDAGGGAGIQALGARNMPSTTRPEHQLPYTPAGLAALALNKPGFGVNEVAPGLINDWLNSCDPGGFPRANLYELRTLQIMETQGQVVLLYQFLQVWRKIWTDGRQLPTDQEPRWYGYSVGKWTDDYTFVVDTVGMNETTWIDNAGRPHSDALKVQEVFHRKDRDTLEISTTIDDPKFYTKPWVALDKFPMRLMPAGFDMMEMLCSASEVAAYNKAVGNPVSSPK
ncbi:MAG: hypothetical protein ABL993_07480 [Vicinamibacterales bacterium]